MSRDEFEELSAGKFKRKAKRRLGLFIDGVGLDRATRRLQRKVDIGRLVAGLCSGLKPDIARYYTLVPYEDDARQFAFLGSVERAGLKVVVKRLPPIGVKRQVSMDVHISTDLLCYGIGMYDDGKEPPSDLPEKHILTPDEAIRVNGNAPEESPILNGQHNGNGNGKETIRRLAVVVCPSRELSYAIDMSHRMGIETSLADFGLYGTSDGWKGVDRWVDLSTSETIWRE